MLRRSAGERMVQDYAFHGVYEHITVEGMDKAVVMVKDIVGMFAK